MRDEAKIKKAHDLLSDLLKDRDICRALSERQMTVLSSAGCALCWALGHENGLEFEMELADIANMLGKPHNRPVSKRVH